MADFAIQYGKISAQYSKYRTLLKIIMTPIPHCVLPLTIYQHNNNKTLASCMIQRGPNMEHPQGQSDTKVLQKTDELTVR